MVGSYPRPHWFKHQLLGRDIRVAFKEVEHEEAYNDAVATVIHDQNEAGLDIVTDGNMWYDDYVGVIGSFCWYLYERIAGFEPARNPHPCTSAPGRAPGRRSWTTGAASSTTAPSTERRRSALGGPLQDRREARATGRSRSRSARAPRTSRGTSTSTTIVLQEREGADLRALPDLQQRNEGSREGRRDLPPDSRTSARGCRCSRTTRTTTSGSVKASR